MGSYQKRALVIEDNVILIDFYKVALSKHGCVVDVAENIESAKRLLDDFDYDLYIVDRKLPDGDGTTLIGDQIPPQKCLVISAYLQRGKDVAELAGELNIKKEHIQHKPITPELMDELITEMFEGLDKPKLDLGSIYFETRKYVVDKYKKTTGKQLFFTFGFVIFLIIFFPTLELWKIHQIHGKFNLRMEEFAEKKFNNFSQGSSITKNSYFEQTISKDGYLLKARFYPEGFVQVILISELYGPVEYWLTEEAYLKANGINHDDGFIDIFIGTWKKTFQAITQVN